MRPTSHRRHRLGLGLVALAVALVGCAAQPPVNAAPSSSPASASTAPPPGSSSPAATASATPSPSPTTTAPAKDTRTKAQRSRAFMVDGIPVISKKHPINSHYRRSSVTSPHGLTRETQRALKRMTAAARAKGVRIVVSSAYRSYAEQKALLARKIREYGSEAKARRYVAAPGRSEHQTGLAVDLWDGVTWGLAVRNTRTGRWLWRHAWRYGFVLRYTNGKEKVTGYAFEPWHYRYIGPRAKGFGPNTNLTLEEYLGLAKR